MEEDLLLRDWANDGTLVLHSNSRIQCMYPQPFCTLGHLWNYDTGFGCNHKVDAMGQRHIEEAKVEG